jgi:hypothetical protein
MKRIFSILLSFALCFININTTVSAEENKSSIISIESVKGKVGETISVPISIKDNPGIISLVTEISYDNSALSFKGVKKSADFWKSATMTPGGDLNAQPYRIIWYDGLSNSDFTEDGTLAELSFEVLKTGSHTIDLSISSSDTFNNNFVKVPFEVKNGVIEVVSSTTSTTTSKSVTTTTTSKATTTTNKSATTTTSTTTSKSVTTTTTSKVTTTITSSKVTSGKLNIGNIEGTIGNKVTVPITINDNPGIISLVAEISYDNSALNFIGVNKSADFWKSATMTPGGDLNSQPYRIIWYDGLAKSDFTEDGTLAELSFEVLKTGSHAIELSISESDTFNNDFVKVPFEVKNGVIKVVSSTTSTTTSKPTTTTTSKVTTTTTTLSNATTTSTTTTLPSVEYKLGDVNNNGTIDAVDASTVLAYYAMISTNKNGGFDENQKAAADVDHDGKINAVDASNILSYYAYVSTTKEEIMSMEEFMKKK